ncbi:MAG: FtsQ-type POTRA domain-containing protein [Verrucomicrobiota bacterium]
MWWKRKPKNRRFEREHILDVKVESRKLRAIRLRLALVILARLFGTAAVVFLLWRGGDWLLDEFVFKNPAFAVQDIDIETDGILPKGQLRAWAGVKVGDNLLALDLNRIQRDLEYMPWIQSAAVERVRPHTIKIRVTEREPIAQTMLFEPTAGDGKARGVIFYFDRDGHVMLPLDIHRLEAANLGFDNLPMLTGVAGVDLRPGHTVESPQILAALQLVSGFASSPMLGLVDLTTIDLSVPHLLQVATAQSAMVVFSVDHLDLQWRRWRLVHDYAARSGKAVSSLDLSVSNNVPARWLEASVVPAPRPKPAKSSPYRKKHV